MAKRENVSLVGAYGLFWERDEIQWRAGSGNTFQMLGYRGTNIPKLEFCDFRKARGVYVLYDNHGPTYVGRARGTQGFGSRLRTHDNDRSKHWVRFCWFSFDPVIDWPTHSCWRQTATDDGSNRVGTNKAIDELEALMITAFGLRYQNQMRLGSGRPWEQVTYQDCGPGERGRRVDPAPIRMPILREALTFTYQD